MKKDGDAQCEHFVKLIDHVEEHYDCIVTYFVTDADGGSKKGCINLGKKHPYLILLSCWAHQVCSFCVSRHLLLWWL